MENLSICQQKDAAKKKRKNKKKKRTGPKQKMSSEDHENDENEDEITKTVRMVDKMFGTHHSHHHAPQNSTTQQDIETQRNSVLYIQYKNLNPQVEMKRMFGKIVNQEHQKKRRTGGTNFRSLKSVYMSNPKESWPPINRTGLFMNIVPTPDISPTKNEKNIMYFSFEHCKLFLLFQKSLITMS